VLSAPLLILIALALAVAPVAGTGAQVQPDVHFVPTPQSTVVEMLEMAKVGPGDVVYDLGSGDGRIVITAVRDFRADRGIGIDIDPERVAEGIANAKDAGVSDRVTFLQANIFEFDFSEATVVTLYLLSDLNIRLKPRLLALRPGTRVVSHAFDMGDWRPEQRTERAYFWIVPAGVQGRWQWTAGETPYRMELSQKFQDVSGTLGAAGETTAIRDVQLTGDRLRFAALVPHGAGARQLRFDGRVTDTHRIEGVAEIAGETHPVVATRQD
jgi:SAM-dependent methyltransferase